MASELYMVLPKVQYAKGEATSMMGQKERRFAPLINVSIEELVPHDHFYRHLDKSLDLSFIRELVHETHAGGGRPSIDPIVFFKLQLVLFFEGLRSERQLMRHAADRLSIKWYLGYDLDEPLPDHSSLTRIRERYGVEVFRRFFEAIVDQCQQAGLVWGKELYVDARHPSMPMPQWTQLSRALRSMRICENSSPRKGKKNLLLMGSHPTPQAKLDPRLPGQPMTR